MTLSQYIDSIHDKKIGVIGIGVSNIPLLKLLLNAGCTVTAYDKRSREKLGGLADELESAGCRFVLGEDHLEKLSGDIIFRSPSLHPDVPQLRRVREAGALVTSEMEVFFSLCPCRTVAVTGSDGKTTTTTILSELLKKQGYRVWLGGNIGTPLLARLPEMDRNDIAVLELSSFQLHSMRCHPNVAVITNISPNHLDIHPSYEDYIAAKKNIFREQTEEDVLVLNEDNDITRTLASEAKSKVRFFSRTGAVQNGVMLKGDTVVSLSDGRETPILRTEEIHLPGAHNTENFMAAFAAVTHLVSPEVCRRVASEFAGVAHRLETIRTLHGIRYINDSIASSPTRTISGLRALRGKPVLIAGGYDKHIPFDALGDEICLRCKALVLCGATASMIRKAVVASKNYDPAMLPIRETDDFAEAVMLARDFAGKGDTVLLSPACASFDKFPNFAVRGDTFRDIVNHLE